MLKDRRQRRRHGRLTARLIALLLLLGVTVAGLNSASAAPPPKPTNNNSNATFGIGPANATGADGRSALNYLVNPGGQNADHVIVHNYSDETLTILVYSADATSAADGTIGFRPRTSPGTDASRWITFVNGTTTVQLVLHPRQAVVLPVNIAVPPKANPGDHLAGVFASLISQVVGKGQQSQKLNLEQRVAVRSYFRISGDIHPQLTVEHLRASYHDNWNPIGKGSASIAYTVHNTGNVTLGGPQSVKVSGLLGSTGVKVAIAQVPPLLPGGSATVRVHVKNVSPEFVMTAKVKVVPAGLPSTVNPGLHNASYSATFWAMPWLLLIIIGLILGGTTWAIIRSRGPRRRYSGERRFIPTPELAGRS